jgi:hypothetical protein
VSEQEKKRSASLENLIEDEWEKAVAVASEATLKFYSYIQGRKKTA